MKRIILCGLIALSCGAATAEPPAGMVLYFQSGGEVYLLLAEHAGSDRGWAGFGGGGREGDSVAETAARKAEEESRGYFKRADLLARIQGQTPLMDGDFASYFAEVGFVPAPSVMNHPVPEQNDAYLERGTFAWIPYSAIAGYLQEDIDKTRKYPVDPAFLPAGSQTRWFWPVWLNNMRKAVATKALPWQRKNSKGN
jgi:8-oxo-dGTP pyrophosphatase MutT (NUDIX family)